MEGVKTRVLVKWQKVFDACLLKQMNSIWQETPQGEIAHIIRAFHQFGAHLEQVDNATLVNPRNEQKWVSQDLVMKICSP